MNDKTHPGPRAESAASLAQDAGPAILDYAKLAQQGSASLWAIQALLIAVALALLLVGQHFHSEYANAHVAADRAHRAASRPVWMPVAGLQSPEPLHRRALKATQAISIICLVNIGVALWSRRWPSVIGLVICCLILMLAYATTGMRF